MPIAYCTFELFLPYSQSLKEKRMVLRKAQDRVVSARPYARPRVQGLWVQHDQQYPLPD